MPYEIPACAGKPYRPSNGTEGMMFEDEFCERCKHDEIYNRTGDIDYACMIHTLILIHQPGDPEYPVEWDHDFKGRPRCTAFEANDRRGPRPPKEPNPAAPVQLMLFGKPSRVTTMPGDAR